MSRILWGAMAAASLMLMTRRARGTPGAVAAEASRELSRWGGRKEDDPTVQDILARYWTEGAREKYPGPGTAWSAAFVSYVANKGAPGSLKPAASHMGYASDALLRGGAGRYEALNPTFAIVEPGDILIRGRAGAQPTMGDLEAGLFMPTHGDIVVSVEPGNARAVGGNVDNSVSVTNYGLTQDGTLVPSENVFTVLKLR